MIVYRKIKTNLSERMGLAARLAGESRQMARIEDGLAARTFLLPWLARPPVGVTALTQLVTHPVSQPVTQPVPVHPAQSG